MLIDKLKKIHQDGITKNAKNKINYITYYLKIIAKQGFHQMSFNFKNIEDPAVVDLIVAYYTKEGLVVNYNAANKVLDISWEE